MAGCALGRCRKSSNPTAQNKTWEATSSLQTMSVTASSPFNSDHAICLHVFEFFVPSTNVTNWNPNVTAARILTMVIKWLSCKGCGSDLFNRDSDNVEHVAHRLRQLYANCCQSFQFTYAKN
jgi:hypothetical protein